MNSQYSWETPGSIYRCQKSSFLINRFLSNDEITAREIGFWMNINLYYKFHYLSIESIDPSLHDLQFSHLSPKQSNDNQLQQEFHEPFEKPHANLA